jgi:hypothetical protein
VVDAVVVEVDGALDEPETQQPLTEIEIGLGLVDSGRDVVEMLDGVTHESLPGRQ